MLPFSPLPTGAMNSQKASATAPSGDILQQLPVDTGLSQQEQPEDGYSEILENLVFMLGETLPSASAMLTDANVVVDTETTITEPQQALLGILQGMINQHYPQLSVDTEVEPGNTPVMPLLPVTDDSLIAVTDLSQVIEDPEIKDDHAEVLPVEPALPVVGIAGAKQVLQPIPLYTPLTEKSAVATPDRVVQQAALLRSELSLFTDKAAGSYVYDDLALQDRKSALPSNSMAGLLPQAIQAAQLAKQSAVQEAVALAAVVSASASQTGQQVKPLQAQQGIFQWQAEQLGLNSPQFGQKLVNLLNDKVNLQLGQNIQRAHIRLDPPQLGTIELSITVDAERTSVHLYASNQQIREAMQQHLEQLRLQLAQRLGNEQILELDVRQQGQQQQADTSELKVAKQLAEEALQDETLTDYTANSRDGWLNRLI